MSQYNAGDKVKWNSSNGFVEGEIIKRITKDTKIKNFTAKPDNNEEEYLIKTSSGKEAIHKVSALTKIT